MFKDLKPSLIPFAGAAGFVLNAAFALAEHWSLQEFCWSTWLAALSFSWACVAVDSVRILLSARQLKGAWQVKVPALRDLPDAALLPALYVAIGLIAWAAFQVYTFLFAFYGLFLSVFSEMEPLAFFGRNGFINSNFFSPVTYLLVKFWPMIVGVLISNLGVFLTAPPWRLLILPFRTGEIIKIHVLVLVMPFLCFLAWVLFRDNYHAVTIILLLGLFYLLPVPQRQVPLAKA